MSIAEPHQRAVAADAAGANAPLLHGREAEREALGGLLNGVHASRSATVMVRGGPGIGKSALVDDLVARADGMRVARAAGSPSESGVPYAGLHQLLRPLLPLLEAVPGPQADALRQALGLAWADNDDPFLVGAGALSLLAAASEQRPMLCVVEDAHWLDSPSADALAFTARRLQTERILLVFTARDGATAASDVASFPELRLLGLDDAAAGALLDEALCGVASPAVRERLLSLARGNPLALRELPLALRPEQLAGRAPLDDPPALTDRLADAFGTTTSLPSDASRLALLVAAADNTGEPAIVARTAAKLGVTALDVEAAEASGLVRLGESAVEFSHPLVRSAVYWSSSLVRRQTVHRALAEELADERHADRRAWQLAAAASCPDDGVAAELERSAERARSRGDHAGAAAALARAAGLTPDDAVRARRGVAAAAAAAVAGQGDAAVPLLAEAQRLAPDAVAQDAERLAAVVELDSGSPSVAYRGFLAAAESVSDHEPDRAAQALLDAAAAAIYHGDRAALAEVARRAQRVGDRSGPGFELSVCIGLALRWDGRAEAAAALEDALRRADTSGHPRRLLWAARCALELGDEAAAHAYAARELERARREGSAATLVSALGRVAFAEIALGRLGTAETHASEALALAAGTSLRNEACHAHALLAWTAALRGRAEDARAHADEALAASLSHERGWQAGIATLALGEAALALGRADEALTHFESLATPGSLGAQPYLSMRTPASLVIAAVRVGRSEVAATAIDTLELWASATESASSRPLLARSRALVASGPAAGRYFEQAVRFHAGAPNPLEHARTELLYGEWLRRGGERRASRGHLRLALELFEKVGAGSWADRADAELRASGERPRAHRAAGQDGLTPQELQVARFVAGGARNKEVAARLFVSPRTVDAHLRSVFRKLGITSRADLRRFRLGDPLES